MTATQIDTTQIDRTLSDSIYKIYNDTDIIFNEEYEPLIKCCVSEKWWFHNSGVAGITAYDTSTYNYCTLLDCCSWCLECRLDKSLCCNNKSNFYICCCVIYFT